jgi:hypothetical protein
MLAQITVNHAARAWAYFLASVGFLADFLQHAAPTLQSAFPNIKWLGPLASVIGMAWVALQHSMDATKQAQ